MASISLKTQARQIAKKSLEDLSLQDRVGLDRLCCLQLEEYLIDVQKKHKRPLTLGWYWPIIQYEPNIWPLCEKLLHFNTGFDHSLVSLQEGTIVYRQFTAQTKLVKVSFGLKQPRSDCPIVKPDIVLIPALAFNPENRRLGWGYGHFDNYLENDSYAKYILGSCYPVCQNLSFPATHRDCRAQTIFPMTP